jgi:hypothetical protein
MLLATIGSFLAGIFPILGIVAVTLFFLYQILRAADEVAGIK